MPLIMTAAGAGTTLGPSRLKAAKVHATSRLQRAKGPTPPDGETPPKKTRPERTPRAEQSNRLTLYKV